MISNPSVQKVNMMGNQNFQVSGNISERSLDSTPEISEEDVKTVMEQSNVSEDEARKAIVDAKGDLAEAIMGLIKE